VLRVGVFLPVANNGWVFSSAADPAPPTFELNRRITVTAEEIGMHLSLAQSVWRGHGGQTGFWDTSIEGISLMGGLARETERIGLVASVNPLLYPAPVLAKMAATLDEMTGGRFGVNIVAGANLAEYGSLGVMPEGFPSFRYDLADDWITAVKRLWSEARVTHHGPYVRLEDAVSGPKPSRRPPIICAGASERGMRFAVDHGDIAFIGTTELPDLADFARRYRDAARLRTSPLQIWTAVNFILRSTDAEAQAEEARYRAAPDIEAIADRVAEYSAPGAGESQRRMIEDPAHHVFFGGAIVGGPARIAEHLIACNDAGCDGVLMTFTDWDEGLALFDAEVRPRLNGRLAGPLPAFA
jgi:pyrimidine oxygenase